MKPNYIKYRLYENGFSLTKLAKKLNVTPQAIHRVIELKSDSFSIAEAVSKAINENIDVVFPDGRYSKSTAQA